MKKIFIGMMVLLLLLLSACGSAPAAANTTSNTTGTVQETDTVSAATAEVVQAATLSIDYDDAASVEQQLLTGILMLEGSDNAITTDQANQLLTLWQSLNAFGPGGGQPGSGGPQGSDQPGSSDSQSTPVPPADQPETNVDAESVLAQIQAIFTDDQIQAISALKITKTAIDTYISINALSMQPADGKGQGGGQQPQGNPPSGDGSQPQGTPPADAGNGQGGPQPDGTLQALTDGNPPDMSTQVLLQAVIQLLQQKTGTTTQIQ
jgi:hypothetical protein